MKIFAVFLAVLALAAPGRAAETKTLETEIPPAKIEGTPVPAKIPNLAPKLVEMPKLQIPAEAKKLSAGKPVTGSDDFPIIGELSFVTDGYKESSDGYFVELMSGLQWVQIDLEKSCTIDAVWLWHFHAQERSYHDVIVQVSDDAEFKNGVTTIFNNDFDDSAGLGVGKDRPYLETNYGLPIDAKGAKGRYVRLYSNGNTSNDANHYIEVEVFGRE